MLIPLAGRGSRLRPFTDDVPKSLLHFRGRTVLSHILEPLLSLDISEYIFVVGYRGDQIRREIDDKFPNISPVFLEQPDQEGLGHAIYFARDKVDFDVPLLIVLGDVIIDMDWKAFIGKKKTFMGVRCILDEKSYGVVELKEGCVQRLVEKPRRTDLAIAGCYLIQSPEILFSCLETLIEKDYRTNGEYQLTDALSLMVDRGVDIFVEEVELVDWERDYR